MQPNTINAETTTESFNYRFMPSVWRSYALIVVEIMTLIDLFAGFGSRIISAILVIMMPLAVSQCRRVFAGIKWELAFVVAYLAAMVILNFGMNLEAQYVLAGYGCLISATGVGLKRLEKVNQNQSADGWLVCNRTEIINTIVYVLITLLSFHNAAWMLSWGLGQLVGWLMGKSMPIRGGNRLHISAACQVTVDSAVLERNQSFKELAFTIHNFDVSQDWLVEEIPTFDRKGNKTSAYRMLAGQIAGTAVRACSSGYLKLLATPNQALGSPSTTFEDEDSSAERASI
jgi:hypothetical protein